MSILDSFLGPELFISDGGERALQCKTAGTSGPGTLNTSLAITCTLLG